LPQSSWHRLLKKLAGVYFVVTPGTVLTEWLLDTFVLATMGAGLLILFHGSLPM